MSPPTTDRAIAVRCAVVILAVLVGGCVGVDAPSLAPRAIERPVAERTPPPVAEPSAADLARIAALEAKAQAGNAAFERALPQTRTVAAPQSDAWAIAQSRISAADLARAPTLDALTALDALITSTLTAQADAGAAQDARTRIQSLVDRQNTRIDALSH